jgi:hypothetical protein
MKLHSRRHLDIWLNAKELCSFATKTSLFTGTTACLRRPRLDGQITDGQDTNIEHILPDKAVTVSPWKYLRKLQILQKLMLPVHNKLEHQ